MSPASLRSRAVLGSVLVVASMGAVLASARAPAAASSVSRLDFTREVQPILVNSCVRCHRAARREGGLRLDTREGLLQGGDSGAAVVPGDGKVSLLYQRLVANDPDERMPQRADPITPVEVETVRRWIDEGADWPDGVVLRAPAVRPTFVAPPLAAHATATGGDAVADAGADSPRISFNRDVRPILADNCYACHGPDRNRRQKSLRLDRV